MLRKSSLFHCWGGGVSRNIDLFFRANKRARCWAFFAISAWIDGTLQGRHPCRRHVPSPQFQGLLQHLRKRGNRCPGCRTCSRTHSGTATPCHENTWDSPFRATPAGSKFTAARKSATSTFTFPASSSSSLRWFTSEKSQRKNGSCGFLASFSWGFFSLSMNYPFSFERNFHKSKWYKKGYR